MSPLLFAMVDAVLDARICAVLERAATADTYGAGWRILELAEMHEHLLGWWRSTWEAR